MRQNKESYKITSEKANTLRYLVTKFDSDGWADAKKSLPIPFELVTVLTDTHKKISAWWTKSYWKGLRLRKKDGVIKWKRKLYERLS